MNHIKLTEEQKEFIRERFVAGETLFDRIRCFEEIGNVTELLISTLKDKAIAAYSSMTLREEVFIISYPDRVKVQFGKKVKQ